MSKKFVSATLALLALSVALTGCGGSTTPAPTPTPSTSATPTPSATPDLLVFGNGDGLPAVMPLAQVPAVTGDLAEKDQQRARLAYLFAATVATKGMSYANFAGRGDKGTNLTTADFLPFYLVADQAARAQLDREVGAILAGDQNDWAHLVSTAWNKGLFVVMARNSVEERNLPVQVSVSGIGPGSVTSAGTYEGRSVYRVRGRITGTTTFYYEEKKSWATGPAWRNFDLTIIDTQGENGEAFLLHGWNASVLEYEKATLIKDYKPAK